MTNPEFEQLKRDLLGETAVTTTDLPGADAPPALSITIDNVPVLLAAHGSDEHLAMLCANCGEIPPQQEAEVMRTVLGASLALYRDMGATFSINPITGHLLVLARIPLGKVRAPRVVEIARYFAAAVNRFAEDGFTSAAESLLPGEPDAATLVRV